MATEMRKTGVDVVGDIPWGTHFCLFYETRADLLETLVSYCKAGLENREFCLWVVAEPLAPEDAKHALKRAVPDADRHLADQSIEIVAARDWYLHDGTFDLNRVISGWNEKLARATARGYSGVRVTGDTAWLEKKDWNDFCEYEESLNQAIAGQRLAVLCTYPLAACGAAEILDVVRTHQFAVTKRRGSWDVIETAGHKQAKAEIKRLNEELEQRVIERTRQLTSVNSELTKEVLQRQRAEEALLRSEAYLAEAQRLSHAGSFGWRPSTGEIIWSEETFRIFQYDRSTKPTVEVFLQRVHPEDVAPVKVTVERASQDGKDFDHEYRLVMPDGAVKHVHVVAHAERDESGELEFVGAVMDTTESKRAEKKLRRSEESLLEGQKLSHTGSWRHDVASGAVTVSPEIHRIHGMKSDDDASNTEFFFSRFHPDDRKRVVDLFESAETEKTEFQVDYRIVLPDGTVKHLHTIGHPILNESGDLLEFVGTAMDVTAAKHAGEALRRSESYLAEAQKLSHTGSWAGAPGTGEIRYWSEECYHVLGFDPHQELPRVETFFQRIHPDDQARTVEQLEGASRAKREFGFDYRIVHPGGDVRDIHTVGHPVLSPSGDLVEYVGTVIDVTERKRAEALRDGESRILEMIARDAPLEEILENLVRAVEAQFPGLLCSVLLLDEDAQHVRHGAAPSLPKPYNDAIDGMCIGPKAGSCGTAMYRREPVVVRDILEDPLWEAYRDVAEPYGLRACWSTPILSHSGRALGTFAMYYREPRSPSPPETRALEMATHLAGIAIERKLAREERERLRQAHADLAHINRVNTMGELTASLAHEIRQPISAAVTNAKTCLRWLGRDQPDVAEACEAASRLVKDVTRAADIIGRISALFKKSALHRELVDVNELIQEMIVLLRSEANRYAISIRTELAEHLPMIMADRVQLQQVFLNLMLNGIDAMKEFRDGSELTIKSETDDGELTISVTDTGVGLPEQADQIFTAFFTTKDNGTGMGLPISRSIVESHGGRLWVAGNSGRGATFHFTLPKTVAAHA
jgi:PAS domain S-box-containing protein